MRTVAGLERLGDRRYQTHSTQIVVAISNTPDSDRGGPAARRAGAPEPRQLHHLAHHRRLHRIHSADEPPPPACTRLSDKLCSDWGSYSSCAGRWVVQALTAALGWIGVGKCVRAPSPMPLASAPSPTDRFLSAVLSRVLPQTLRTVPGDPQAPQTLSRPTLPSSCHARLAVQLAS